MSAAANAPWNRKTFDADFAPLANVLLQKVKARDAILYETQGRARSFKGSRLISALKDDPAVQRALKTSDITEEGEKLAERLLVCGFFLRVAEVENPTKRHLVRVVNTTVFDDKEQYVWVYEGSKTKQIWMSVAFLLTVAGLFLIKVWPIWLKIAVYWISLTLLVTQLSILGVRLALYCVMWLLGFRGLWLFPNLLSDELGVWDSFNPVFGRGVDLDELRKMRRRKRKEEETAAKEEAEGTERKKEELPKQKAQQWNFGMINALAVTAIGVFYCYQIGLFSPQLVPDFVASHNDLYQYFPAIGPPPADKAEPVKDKVKNVNPQELFESIHKMDADGDNDDDSVADTPDNTDSEPPKRPNKTPSPPPPSSD